VEFAGVLGPRILKSEEKTLKTGDRWISKSKEWRIENLEDGLNLKSEYRSNLKSEYRLI